MLKVNGFNQMLYPTIPQLGRRLTERIWLRAFGTSLKFPFGELQTHLSLIFQGGWSDWVAIIL